LKVLLVRLRQIGDVVFTTPAVRAIRERFPRAHLTYIVEPAAAPVVQSNPQLDQVIVAPRHSGLAGIRADFALGLELWRSKYDIAIDFHGGPRASWLTWLSRAPLRIGYTVAGRTWMYTHPVARTRQLRARHSVENQWDLLAPLGITPGDPDRYPVEMPVDPTAAATVNARLARHAVPADARLIIVHVSAGNPFRRWPIDSFADVAADLARRDPPHYIVFTCGPSEQDALARVIGAARERLEAGERHLIVDCGEFPLLELRALVDRAVLYVGSDSGPMHIASTGHAPIVSLYGPTLPARSAPWRSARWLTASIEVQGLECRPCDQRVCRPGDFRCLTRIRPTQVVEAAGRLLDRTDNIVKRPGRQDE
jgi:lipopolysaccharide heptosyltransferase II